jgi:DNA primase
MVDQIEEIKRRIDVVQFINQYVPLKRAGRNFKALCPFHSEKTPSFIVSPERQIWHCFGACNEGGDVFKFLMKIENIDFGEALRQLAKLTGVKITSYRPTEAEKNRQLLYEINHLAAEFYHFLLLNHPAGKVALNYILGRGIKKESLEKFQLGYAPNMWDGLQRFLVGKKGYKVADLEKAGLIIPSSRPQASGLGFYDRFRHRLMFPLRDHRGNIRGFAGRVLDPEAKEAKYINTPETMIYHKSELLYGLFENKEEIKKEDRVILVEGELDVISSWQAGIKNVVAIKGSALTFPQVQLLSRFTKNLVFALDADIAGNQAAWRGAEIADQWGMEMKVVQIKGGKDPDEVAQKNPQLWRQLVEGAVPLYDYFLDSAFSRFGGKTAEEKRKISQVLIPVLAKINDKIVQSHYIKVLAERLGVEEEAVVLEIEKFVSRQISSFPLPAKTSSISKDRREILEEYLLALGFQSTNWSWLVKRKVFTLVKTLKFLRILEILKEYLGKHQKISSQRLVKLIPPELEETFNRLYLLDLEGVLQDEDKTKKEFQKTLLELEKIYIKEQLKQLAEEIERLESQAGEEKALEKLSKKFRDLGIRLAELSKKE